MDAETVIRSICSGFTGINLQTIVRDPSRDEYDARTVFRDDEVARVSMHLDSRNIRATLTMLDDEDFENILYSLGKMNEMELPEDGSGLLNIITFVPQDFTEGSVMTYASAFIGLFIADDENLTVQFVFPREDFAVFGLDLDKLQEQQEEPARE